MWPEQKIRTQGLKKNCHIYLNSIPVNLEVTAISKLCGVIQQKGTMRFKQ